mmetsp:Transcript_19270/g.55993  ORF Transcript_19270/g.55993 Transcript_19270/m.55993 type:complete len:232 (-) Transcript_19270:3474-4169(-)
MSAARRSNMSTAAAEAVGAGSPPMAKGSVGDAWGMRQQVFDLEALSIVSENMNMGDPPSPSPWPFALWYMPCAFSTALGASGLYAARRRSSTSSSYSSAISSSSDSSSLLSSATPSARAAGGTGAPSVGDLRFRFLPAGSTRQTRTQVSSIRRAGRRKPPLVTTVGKSRQMAVSLAIRPRPCSGRSRYTVAQSVGSRKGTTSTRATPELASSLAALGTSPKKLCPVEPATV